MEFAVRVLIEHPLIFAVHMAITKWQLVVGDYGDMMVQRRPRVPAETEEDRA